MASFFSLSNNECVAVLCVVVQCVAVWLRYLHLDGLGAVRTYGNVGDFDLELLLYEGNVTFERCR